MQCEQLCIYVHITKNKKRFIRNNTSQTNLLTTALILNPLSVPLFFFSNRHEHLTYQINMNTDTQGDLSNGKR